MRWILFTFFCLLSICRVGGQSIRPDGGQYSNVRTAVPFLLIAPDAKAGAMGDVGVATEPDPYAIHWNAAKYAFAEESGGVALSFTPWLRQLADDISLSYLSGYARLNERQTLAASFTYFSLGEVRFADGQGNEYLQYRAFEAALDAAYILKLSDYMALATTFRYIYSGIGAGDYLTGEAFPGRAIAFDVGWYRRQPVAPDRINADLAFGIQLSNLGTRMQYGSNDHFLPMNLRMGTAYTHHLDGSRVSVALDLNKLLVPTEPERDAQGNIIKGKNPDRSITGAVFGSFTDAPGGLLEELSEVRISTGLEWSVGEQFALRGGYYHTSPRKDDLRYFTVGMGLRYERLRFDFSYLISARQQNPLRNTLRFGLSYGW
ncbi:type IX secretion system outer membrane channel protein PorV [Parapedobacter sp. ISTM3]|uniref:type IX secretion system outer membrane channel protein PorV n=1 Tax=Parapedobacter sp. ISTM3 TaxID=2800130 RepID=UPI001906AF96|nr:type IX secretion system outer membrane channel protein PorV [Parapedobacter sp. ISTM3]MBK1440152.1 type IX secretion system outer membrane channel protein PorV [Parapedobacter sp. ISTM3]